MLNRLASEVQSKLKYTVFRMHANQELVKSHIFEQSTPKETFTWVSLIAKSRVAPIKPISIPRMELTAAVVSVNVTKMLERELDYESLRSLYYTDSEVVIGYISNDARRFHVYVGNGVQHIRDRSDPEQWHHVSGKDNPADEASRSLTASQLHNNKKWLSGPDFL